MKQHFYKSSLLSSSLLAAIALASVAISIIAVRRTATKDLQSCSEHSASDYDTALERFARLESIDEDPINPVCRSQLLTHGHKTERVIVLIHGLTNCPRQYVQFAPLLYKRGYNVLVPRLPHHGLADRFTHDLKHLSAQELRDFIDAVIDIASGVGDQVTVAGISAGGVIAAWVLQYRPDVERVILIAPALGVLHFGLFWQWLIMTLCLLLPDGISRLLGRFKDAPDHCYLGYSTHALGEVSRLGFAVLQAAKKDKPAGPSALVITNAVDTQVDNQITALLVKRWLDKGLEHLERYEFEAKEGLIHDIIDPAQPKQRTPFVYPILLDLVTEEKAK
jgi:pimeloyl-ACP methyl ester carboxylesterase